MTQAAQRSGFRSAFGVREFRALWAAEALSQLGDQLARVALAVLVYSRTNSAALAALTIALSYTPSFLGSALLSGLADRFPRREVMIVCDLLSASLVILMALPGVPLTVVCVAMAGVSLVGGPFRSARLALLPEVLSGEAYVAGLAIRSITIQTAQLLGFALGGVVVALINPYLALAVDALTFLASALLLRLMVPWRPAPQHPNARRAFWASSIHGARVIAGIPGLPALFVLGMLAGLYIGPEGLATAWVAEMGETTKTVGLVMGAPAAGLVVGAWLMTKFVPAETRLRLVGPMASLAGIVLMLCALRPGLFAVLGILFVSGMFTAYQVLVGAAFGTSTPADSRASVMGLLNSGVLTAQGVGVLIAGILADYVGVGQTVAIAGALGAVIAIPAAVAWNRATTAPQPATGV
ncbi:MFS transporter [Kibdelosporangium aridum]|uniref:Predicted arabinose efflux permease, MFS family n=2 Tax=Kibdelosporangium aridum TaxID=2030 RepID=A0A1W2DQZ2_KIBAR|nr:MFS transporter [Kibdelosporangium aridum]SMC99910.1 Predicted arabinose efflux permease, MFS family [Kibdelosporangium aridum]